jgi:hypothetical protein
MFSAWIDRLRALLLHLTEGMMTKKTQHGGDGASEISLATPRRQADVYGRCWSGRLANGAGGALCHAHDGCC